MRWDLSKSISVLVVLLAFIAGLWLSYQVNHRYSGASNHSIKPEKIKDVEFLLEQRLLDLNGVEVQLTGQLKKLNLINYWATWCAPCRDEMPLFNSVYELNQQKGFQVLGLALDDSQSVRLFVDELAISYPILLLDDEQGWDILALSGNSRNLLPYSLLVDQQGKVLEQKLGILHSGEISEWLLKYL